MDTLVRYLAHVLEANRRVNLTRITSPREAVVKHLVDSLLPAAVLETGEGAFRETLLDLGTGPGFPGVALAVWFPEARVHLVESVGKKARVVEETVRSAGIANVTVHARRAEELLQESAVHTIVARAVGSARKLLRLLRRVRGKFQRLVLYKGPEAAAELEEARRDAEAMGLWGEVARDYALPDDMGRRSVLLYSRKQQDAEEP